MAKQANTLTEDVRELHRKLALANFSAFTAEGAAKRDLRQARQLAERGRANQLITMAALVGIDTHQPDPADVFAVTYGAEMVRGRDAISVVEETNGNAQSDAIANAFEAMERFVADISAKYLYARRGHIPIHKNVKKRAKSRFGKKAAEKNTPLYFEQIVAQLSSRNCDDLFKILFKHSEGLRERIENYHFGDLHDIHAAVEHIRHRKTHANGRYDAEKSESLALQTRRIIQSLIRESVIHGDDRILPDYDQAKDLLAREAEYGQILYEHLSDELKMRIDYCPT